MDGRSWHPTVSGEDGGGATRRREEAARAALYNGGGGHNIRPQPHVKYLGVVLDSKLRFDTHVKLVAEKAGKCAMAISRLMARVGGAGESKRRLLSGVADSMILYAPSIWNEALRVRAYRGAVERVERRLALRICGAYRTASTDALRVVSRRAPLELVARARTRARRELRSRDEQEAEVLVSWQTLWDESTKGRWAYRLIRQIGPWYKRAHGEVNTWLAQFLTGHGCFRAYLARFGILADGNCPACGVPEDAEHVVFNCPEFDEEREPLREALGANVVPEDLVERMLESEAAWNAVELSVRRMMRRKERENLRQRGRRV